MCGFTGYGDLRNFSVPDAQILARMTQVLVHRGPDSDGFFIEDGIGIGFRRLKIIDLHTGEQPIHNEDGSVVMVCNGEIYNYRELREELKAKGHRFKTQTDVEVILHLYEEYGQDFINRLNGQFAFVIYDRREKSLFMARDQMGINPLHYTMVGDTLIFASEIKAILEHPLVSPEVDLTALDQMLSFPGVVSPRTMFKGISSLPAGHALYARNGQVETFEYWDLEYPEIGEIAHNRSEESYIEEMSELLAQAVRLRLHADVPVGYYLSGGLDSSLIAALATRASGTAQLDSFSIEFDDPEVNESQFQRMMVEQLKSRHHETRFGASCIAERLKQMIYHCECPTKEAYNTCAMSLSAMARQKNVPVILAGQGADELFGGYMGYRVDQSGTREMGFGLEAALEDEVREALWGDPSIFYEKEQYAYREVKQALYSPAVNASFDSFECTHLPLVNKARLKGRSVFHQRAYLDFKLRLQDHLLSEHGDRMVMMHSIEGRYPFLDPNMIEFVRTLPESLKLNGFEEKYLVKKVAEPWVPSQIVTREKFGFRAPGSPYLLQQGIEWIDDLLSHAQIKRQGYFNPDTIERLKKRYSKPGFKLNAHLETDLLMVVLTFNLFLELFKIPNLC